MAGSTYGDLEVGAGAPGVGRGPGDESLPGAPKTARPRSVNRKLQGAAGASSSRPRSTRPSVTRVTITALAYQTPA